MTGAGVPEVGLAADPGPHLWTGHVVVMTGRRVKA